MSTKSRRPVRPFRPRITRLEDRTVPATFTVTTGTDVVNANDNLTSLREAVTLANTTAGADTINFAANVTTATLTAATLTLTETGQGNATTIAGGTTGVTVNRDFNAQDFFAVFTIAADAKGIFRNLTISGGAGSEGGGIASSGNFEVVGCTIANNGATGRGGAIFSSGLFPSYVINSTLSGNTASGTGGGIQHGTGDLFITNSTIFGNTSNSGGFNQIPTTGGGLSTTGQATVLINNTIFADNTTDTVGANDIDGDVGAASFNNIVTSATSAGGMTILNANQIGVASATFIVPTLANNGGPTRTHLIQTNGSAVNRGSAAEANDANNNLLATDQRGLPRVVGGEVDVGAVEVQTPVPPPPPPPPPPGGRAIQVVGGGQGGLPVVRVLDAVTGTQRFSLMAFDANFRGGVTVATGGDLTGDGNNDFVVAAGQGGGPHVKVYDGATGRLVREFFAYDGAFRGGVTVALADTNGDGVADVITGAGQGGGPHVKVFSGANNALLTQFLAYGAAFRGGVAVAAGDLNGDNRAEVVTGAGFGGGPHVKAFNVAAGNALLRSFFAYDPSFRGGVAVAVGDVNGDGQRDIITGARAGGGPHVKVFNGQTGALVSQFFAYEGAFRGGLSVAASDANGDGVLDVLTGPASGGSSLVRAFRGANGTQIEQALAFDPAFTGGVSIA